jgi:hypothetical protein
MRRITSWMCLLGASLAMLSPSALAEALCAQVKIEIQQELTLERQAFDAKMRINNGLDTLSIEDVSVTVNFQDDNGNSVSATNDPNDVGAAFFIRIDSLANISDVSGTGSVAPGTSAEIHWLIIPSPGAAADLPGGKLFFVGAHLSYTLGGTPESVDVTPDFITVKPLPRLTLDYFLTTDVVADDAFTSVIEPPEPYTLGVRVKNDGIVAAKNLKIDSAQPRIVENEQGLLIGFQIVGSSLDDLPVSPVLLMDFGDVGGNASRVGRWVMTSTLSGQFTDFTASYSHADELGGAVTSLLEAVNTHSLVHDVRVDLAGRDDVRDFLAQDVDVYRVYESEGLDTEVTDHSADATLSEIGSGADYTDYRLSFPSGPGFSYVRLPDPHGGAYAVRSVSRSDGKALPLDNLWTSQTRNRNTNPSSWDYHVNLFDVDSTGSYIVRLGVPQLGTQPPVLQFIPDRVTYEAGPLGFVVQASDPNGQTPSLSAAPLPAGAKITDNGDGSAYFDWVPQIGQAGTYILTFTASDGTLKANQTVKIIVNPDADRDGDGMDDDWELLYFATLDRDGTGDYDGDGVTDLQEFKDGTDPTRSPGPGQPVLLAPTDGAELDILTPELVLQNGEHSGNMTVTYQFEVYADPALTEWVTGTSGVAENASGSTSWFVAPPLSDNTWYYWRGRAFDGAVTSEWVSGSFFVNTVNDPPGPISVSEPQDGSIVATLTPSLAVTNSTDIDGDSLSYGFRVYADGDMTTPVAEVNGLPPGGAGTTQWSVDIPLVENGLYSWLAVVTDEHGAETYSELASFLASTVNDAPSLPGIVGPAVGAEVPSLDVDVVVSPATDPEGGVVGYVFELDTVDTFDSTDKRVPDVIYGAGNEIVWPVTGLTENTWYYWRVKATDGDTDSAWVSGRFFVNVANDPPPVPVAANPGESGWVGTLNPTLQLAPISDVDGDALHFAYEVYRLNPRGVFKELVAAGESDTPDWQVTPTLPRYGWYAWRAQATDEHGAESGWMIPVRFFADDDGKNDPPVMRFFNRWLKLGHRHAHVPAYRLRWFDADPDSNANISLFYDADTSGTDGTLIAEGIKEDPDGWRDTYLWRPNGVAPGVYHIYGVIDDGQTAVTVSAANPILIGDGNGHPFMSFKSPHRDILIHRSHRNRRGSRIPVRWEAFDSDSDAIIDLYYTTDPDNGSGTLIAGDIRVHAHRHRHRRRHHGRYLWNISRMPVGRYYIYGVIRDESHSLRVFAPGAVQIVEGRRH